MTTRDTSPSSDLSSLPSPRTVTRWNFMRNGELLQTFVGTDVIVQGFSSSDGLYLASDVDPMLSALAEAEQELRMGHVRIDECLGVEATVGQPLYDRISFVLQRTSDRLAERDCNISLLDLLTRSKSPCGHWGSHAYSPDGVGKHILCLDCENAALTARAEAAEVDNARLRSALAS